MEDKISLDQASMKQLVFDSRQISSSSPSKIEDDDESLPIAINEARGHISPKYEFNKSLCLIFSNEDRDLTVVKSNILEGNEVDIAGIENYFGNIGFEVRPYREKTADEIKNILEAIAIAKTESYDLLICFILAHGDKDLLCAKNSEYYWLNTLFEPFLPSKCERLNGKPKLFIIDACQGDACDQGNTQYDACDVPIDTPEDDDFLVALSSVPGFRSLQSSKNGSFYTQAFLEALKDSKSSDANEDIHSILTKVHCKIANITFPVETIDMTDVEKEKFKRVKQMPIFFSTLRDKLAINRHHTIAN